MTNLVTIVLMTNIFILSHPSGGVDCRKDVICAEVRHQVDVVGETRVFTNYVYVATNIYDPVWILRVPTNRPKIVRDPLNYLPPSPPVISPPVNKQKKGKL